MTPYQPLTSSSSSSSLSLANTNSRSSSELDLGFESNPLLIYLQTKQPKVLQRAAASAYLVALPPRSLLRASDVTREIAEAHVLVRKTTTSSDDQSSYDDDDNNNNNNNIIEFTSVNARHLTLNTKTNTLTAKQGYPEPGRQATLLGEEELMYTPECGDEPLRLVAIAQPLDVTSGLGVLRRLSGSLRRDSAAAQRAQAAADAAAQVAAQAASHANPRHENSVLESLPFNTTSAARSFLQRSSSAAVDAADAAVQQFNRTTLVVNGSFLPATAARLGCIALRLAAACGGSREAVVAAECVVMAGVHEQVLTSLIRECLDDDRALQSAMMRMRKSSSSDDAKYIPGMDVSRCAYQLRVLSECTCPLEKMHSLRKLADFLGSAANAAAAATATTTIAAATIATSTSSSSSDNDPSQQSGQRLRRQSVATDELLPCAIAALLQSQASHVFAELRYLREFASIASSARAWFADTASLPAVGTMVMASPMELGKGALAFQLTTLEAAAAHIMNAGAETTSVDNNAAPSSSRGRTAAAGSTFDAQPIASQQPRILSTVPAVL